jgi:hypothetical protein
MADGLTPATGESIFEYLDRVLDPDLKKRLLQMEIKPAIKAAIQAEKDAAKAEKYELAREQKNAATEMQAFMDAGDLMPKGKLTQLLEKLTWLTCLGNCGFNVKEEKHKVLSKLQAQGIHFAPFPQPEIPRAQTIDEFLIKVLPQSVKDLLRLHLSIMKDEAVKNAEYEKAQDLRIRSENGQLPPSGRLVNSLRKMVGLMAAEKGGFNIDIDISTVALRLVDMDVDVGAVIKSIKSRFPEGPAVGA